MPMTKRVLFLLTSALMVLGVVHGAAAGPGDDGAVVIIDQPNAPDLIIQDLREENLDASHAPVNIRLFVPDTGEFELHSASVEVSLTKNLMDPDAPRFSETTIKIEPAWLNRAVLVQVPSPGEGEYFVQVHADLYFTNHDPVAIDSSTMQRVRFGVPLNCTDVEDVVIPDAAMCAVLFEQKGTMLFDGRLGTSNEKVIASASQVIDDLCRTSALHRVSVRGWASKEHSVNPTNEELAQDRAKSVFDELRLRVPACKMQIQNDSVKGTRGVTTQFGKDDDDKPPNRCAEIVVTRHTCSTKAAP